MARKFGDTFEDVDVDSTTVTLGWLENAAYVYVGDDMAGYVLFEGYDDFSVVCREDGLSWWANGNCNTGNLVAQVEFVNDRLAIVDVDKHVKLHLVDILKAWDGENHEKWVS